MQANERTQDIYEEVGGYPKPPLIPLPELGDLDSMERMGIRIAPFSRRVLNFFMKLSGFNSYYKTLPEHLDHTLRTTNLRVPGLFSPLISATLSLPDDPRALTPAQRGAALIFGVRSFYDDLMSGKLPGDQYNGEPLEMGQYPNLFSTSVILERGMVRLFKSTKITQVTVIAYRRFFILEMGDLGTETSFEQLSAALQRIIERARTNPLRAQENPVGYLTCASHETQFKYWRKFRGLPGNQKSLDIIRHSFLTLCLDLDSYPQSDAEVAYQSHSGNSANRWWHSSLQLVVFGNARSGAICNFTAYLDGNTMMRSAAEIAKRAAVQDLVDESSHKQSALPEADELSWKVPQEMLRQARRDLLLVTDNQQATFEIEGIGRKVFNERKVPAVPAFICALQMTTNRIVGAPGMIYQFLTQSRYRYMDLSTSVTSTPEVLEFVNTMLGENVDKQQARNLLQSACSSQLDAARKARQYLNLPVTIDLFFDSLGGFKRRFAMSFYNVCLWLLKVKGYFKPVRREIIVSHPEIYPEIKVVGRPGVRLSYVRYYSLHYQLLDDKTVITMMPAMPWTIPNGEFIADLRRSLQEIMGILD